MNDHNCPDKNCYMVYAEVDWVEISTDKEEKLNMFDIPVSIFDVYKCPTCGRLMFFGEDNRFKVYVLDE